MTLRELTTSKMPREEDVGSVPTMLQKVLTHRLRRFSQVDQSLASLKLACSSEARYLEVDTRASHDGKIYISHSRYFGKLLGKRYFISRLTSQEIEKIGENNGESLLSLETALEIFRTRGRPYQKLCLDIKDYGFERRHLELVRTAGLESQVCFLSWIPQTLQELYRLGTRSPLILAHCNFMRWREVGQLLVDTLANRLFRLDGFVILGRNRTDAMLSAQGQGFQYALFCTSISVPFDEILIANAGGICIHLSMICPKIINYCRETGLSLWVFSVGSFAQFKKYAAQPDIDVVFCNDAPNVLRHLEI
jgi:hypothetical protein